MSHPARIEQLVRRTGASRYVYDWRPRTALIGFELAGRHIRLQIALPAPDDPSFTRTPSRGEYRAPATAQKLYEQACFFNPLGVYSPYAVYAEKAG